MSVIQRAAGGHAVLAAVFAEVELLVRLYGQGEVAQLLLRAAGHAEGGGDDAPVRQVGAGDGGGAHRLQQLAGHAAGLVLGGVGQNHHELLAAEAEEVLVGLRQNAEDALGHPQQHLVALHVGIVVVIGFEVVDVVDDGADALRALLFGDKGAVGFQGLFAQRAGHDVVVGQLDEGVAHLPDVALVGGLAEEDGVQDDEPDDDGNAQQEVLEQVVVLRVGQLAGQIPADEDEDADENGVGQGVGGRDHDEEQIAHGDGEADAVVIAGDHKDGDGGDDHGVERQQGKPGRRCAAVLAAEQKDQHGQARAHHHVEGDHVQRQRGAEDVVPDQVEAVGQQEQERAAKDDGQILLHENALRGGYLVHLCAENAAAKALEPRKGHVRHGRRQLLRHGGGVCVLPHSALPLR